MPRSPRIEYEGALYHVLCRGDRRDPIFRDDRDRRNFLETLGEACERSGAFVCSYVLMDNHYHLLLETPLGNLVATMTLFQSTVTARFNARRRVRGHLFQGRSKALPVESGSREYARTVSAYIPISRAVSADRQAITKVISKTETCFARMHGPLCWTVGYMSSSLVYRSLL